MNHIKYRPDIDGLRAIAVLSVVINHINSSLLSGGFIGVDIFFVISGFLITSQIVKEISAEKFSIANFYKRRINRIVPALLLVVSVSLILGIFLLSPVDFTALASSSFYSVIGVSNIFFWHEYGNYFTGNRSEAILLHTWSLGVEEQFYVLWPLLLLLLTKLSARFLSLILVFICLLTLAFSEFGANNFASASYYFLPTRFFELALGGLLANSSAILKPKEGWLNFAMVVVGFLLIIVSLFKLSKDVVFPGINALYPCLGTAILIWCGSSQKSLSRKILANKVFIFIGVISYSLYLVHWPVIAYLNYIGVDFQGIKGFLLFAVCVVLAWLSWKYVEVPLRKSGALMTTSSVFLKRFAVPVGALILLFVASIHFHGFPARFSPEVASYEKMAAVKPNELREGCHVPTALYSTDINTKCRLGRVSGDVDGILIGDSFANHFSGMVDVIAKSDGISIVDYTMDSCAPILNYDSNRLASYAEKCKARNKHVYELIAANKYKYVVLAAHWPDDSASGTLIEKSIEQLIHMNTKVVVILNNPSIVGGATCSVRKIMYGRTNSCDVLEEKRSAYWQDVKRLFPQVLFVDPNQAICLGGECKAVINKTLLYRDDVHLNDVGSRLIGRMLVSSGVSFLK